MKAHDYEELAELFERTALHMSKCALEHREAGDEDGAKHCVGGAEMAALLAAFVRLQAPPRLVVVS